MQRQFISVLAICLPLTTGPNFIPGCCVLVRSQARNGAQPPSPHSHTVNPSERNYLFLGNGAVGKVQPFSLLCSPRMTELELCNDRVAGKAMWVCCDTELATGLSPGVHSASKCAHFESHAVCGWSMTGLCLHHLSFVLWCRPCSW